MKFGQLLSTFKHTNINAIHFLQYQKLKSFIHNPTQTLTFLLDEIDRLSLFYDREMINISNISDVNERNHRNELLYQWLIINQAAVRKICKKINRMKIVVIVLAAWK
jgi:hypothetical protein